MDWKETIPVDDMLRWRRHIHQYPEIAFQEKETAGYIAAELANFPGIEVSRPTETSVVGTLNGTKPGKTIAFRADIDALEIAEDSGVPFTSQNEGVSHACGHDCHAAMLLGTAKVLSGQRDSLAGSVKFIFQHAEEKPPGGAIDLVNAGVLDGVEYIFGQHVAIPAPLGLVLTKDGVHSASQDIFDITIQGKSCHGSMPHTGIDPITIGAEVVNCLNSILAKNIDAQETAVLSLGQFSAGHTHNVVPDHALIKGNIRTFSEEVRQTIMARVDEIVAGIAKAFNTTYEIKWAGYPSMKHDEDAVRIMREAAKKVVGEKAVITMPKPVSSSEDFSNYEKVCKGAFYFLGFGTEEQGAGGITHNPKFKVNESALPIGTQIFVQIAMDLLGG